MTVKDDFKTLCEVVDQLNATRDRLELLKSRVRRLYQKYNRRKKGNGRPDPPSWELDVFGDGIYE